MRIRMISALCGVLPLIYSPRPAAAQFNPALLQSPQASFRKLPWPAKLSEFQRSADSGNNGLRFDLTNEATNVLRSLRNLLTQREGASAKGIQSPVERSQCAHIVMFQAPDVDSKMILEVPEELVGNMPGLHGLQACSRDFRSVVAPSAVVPLDGGRFLFLPESPRQASDKPILPLAKPLQLRPDERPRR